MAVATLHQAPPDVASLRRPPIPEASPRRLPLGEQLAALAAELGLRCSAPALQALAARPDLASAMEQLRLVSLLRQVAHHGLRQRRRTELLLRIEGLRRQLQA
jgi:hypothetical protein